MGREESTFFHIILTTECNLQCTYCYGEAIEDVDPDFPDSEVDYHLPRIISYGTETLDRFCRQDPDCVLTFYGGEPLLQIDKVKSIMDNVHTKHFMIQTNGLFLNGLEPEYVNRFHTILVSLDGDEDTTDSFRGKGTFRKVINNLKLIRKNGFEGEVIARMTIMEPIDVYKQVNWLLGNAEFLFSSVHWQLNAGFWKNDFQRRKFHEWISQSYNPGIHSLAKSWVDRMEDRGVVLRLYPFLGIAQSFLEGETQNMLRCGGGWANYAIQTDGYIVPCPTMWGMKNYYLGHIDSANPLNLKQIFVGEPCSNCDILDICGGRCLYANITKRWDKEAYASVCDTVRNLIESISEQTPRIRNLIKEQKINPKSFEYMKYNGCEIIP